MGIGYANPQTLPELFQAMAAMPRHHIFAGGTDMLVRKGKGTLVLENIISLHRLCCLSGIKEKNGMLEIGALTTHSALVDNAQLRISARALCDAAAQVGSLQIRNLGTLGGNLCNASPAADTATPLLALNAQVRLVSQAASRVLPLTQFFTGPGKTALMPGEVLEAVLLPLGCPLGGGAGSSFIKLAKRKALAISVVNGAAWVSVEGGTLPRIAEARLALGSVAPTPLRLDALEEWLKGKPLVHETFVEAGSITEELVKPISDIRSSASYRRGVSGVLVTRLLAQAAVQAQEGCRS